MYFLILKHVAHEGPGLLQDYLDQHGHSYQIVELEHGEPIPSYQDFDVIALMGGPMNVYQEDDYPFLAEETRLIEKALAEEKPILGFCLGAQLLAKAAGARIKENLWKEIGNKEVHLTEAGLKDPLFKGFGATFPVFQWHGDTFELPGKGTNLAESDECRHQVLKIGKKAYGLQFHLELTSLMLEEWFVINEQEIYEEQMDPSMITDQFTELEGTYGALAYQLFDNFMKILEK